MIHQSSPISDSSEIPPLSSAQKRSWDIQSHFTSDSPLGSLGSTLRTAFLFYKITYELSTGRTMHAHTTNIPSSEMASQEIAMVPEEVGHETSLVKSLSFLDRFLAVWILLAMALGIILGYFVPTTQNVLNTADFVGVSVPIGNCSDIEIANFFSGGTHCHDVPNSM